LNGGLAATAASRGSSKGRTNARIPAPQPALPIVALGLALALLGAGVGIAAAKKADCRSVIAGTYYKSAGAIYNLSPDGTITGNLSETIQVLAGQGDTFFGMWQCDETTVTGHDYRWVDAVPRQLSRVDWDGTFTPADGGTLTIHFEFARVPETATAADVLSAPILFDDDIVAIRIATP
jgi:hypothetical protein